MQLRSVAIAAARIGFGWVFLWAFLDKTFGLGWSTPQDRAWINGGSPTEGYLGSRSGWFDGAFNAMAGSALVEWLFMLGLLGIGSALILGIGMRVATISGSALMVLMYLSNIPFSRDSGAANPLWDSHLTNIALLLLLYFIRAGQYYGLGDWWAKQAWVQKAPWLR